MVKCYGGELVLGNSQMKTCIFVIATESHAKLYEKLVNSIRKFHPDIEIIRYHDEDIKATKDPAIFYRATPYFAKKLMDQGYELVIKMDADSIVTGSLERVLQGNYEVGTVLNYNRVDPMRYGQISVGTVNPGAYYNCGFVAMTSKKFVEHWLRLCYTPHFDMLQYREQDLLNIITHYGDYKVTCFDEFTPEYSAWHGLVAKGEGLKMIVKKGEIVLPASPDGYPKHDKLIKVLHNAGGSSERPIQDVYRTQFSEEVIHRLTELMEK